MTKVMLINPKFKTFSVIIKIDQCELNGKKELICYKLKY